MHYELDETWMPFSSLMLKHIYNVLLICSEYDRFMLEEDGRVEEELYKEYTSLGLSNPPKITHVSTEDEALVSLKNLKFDLVISMLDLGSGRVEALAEQACARRLTVSLSARSQSISANTSHTAVHRFMMLWDSRWSACMSASRAIPKTLP